MSTTEGELRKEQLPYEKLRARKGRRTTTVRLALEPGPAEALAEARRELDEAKLRVEADPSREAKEAKARALSRLDEAIAAAEGASYEFVLQSISKRRFDALVQEHPPTPKQIADAEKRNLLVPDVNVDTFAPALVAACCIDPTLTLEQAQEMWEDEDSDWSQGELNQLWWTARSICTASNIIDLGKGSDTT
jgi:hypothetical protein